MREFGQGTLPGSLVYLSHFLIFCVSESIPWAWGLAGSVPIWVLVISHLSATYAFLIMALLGAGHVLKTFRWFRRQWKWTFPRRR